MEKEKISVVIPVYNAGRFLEETLSSVLEQTEPVFQLIVVDDGSTDDSPEILRRYQERFDGRMELLTQENQGGSAARNAAIPRIRGDFVVFFDADDIMEPDLVEQLSLRQRETGADLVDGGRTIIDEQGGFLDYKGTGGDRTVVRTHGEAWQELMHLEPYPGKKLYSVSLIRRFSLRFGDTGIGQDLNFFLKFLAVCDVVSLLDRSVFRYRVVQDSISHKNGRRMLDIFGNLNDVSSFAKEVHADPFFRKELYNVRIQHYYFQLKKSLAVADFELRKELFERLSRGVLHTAEKGEPYLNDKYRKVVWKVKNLRRIRGLLVRYPELYSRLVHLYRLKRGTVEEGRLGDIM